MGREVFIASAVRTPIGKMGGVLSSVPAARSRWGIPSARPDAAYL